MSLLRYAKQQFLVDLKAVMAIGQKVSDFHASMFPDIRNAVFIGGEEWERFEEEIKLIAPEHHAFYCVCLLAAISTDKNNHANMSEYRALWESAFKHYPKFGWVGFGPHFEPISFLCEVPARAGIDFNSITDAELDEFVEYFSVTGKRVYGERVRYFFGQMVEDREFNNQCEVIRRMRESIIRVFGFDL